MAKKFLLGIVAAAAMVGCIKRQEVEPTDVTLGSATIQGNVRVSTIVSNDTLDQSMGLDENRSWEYDQIGNVTLKFTYDASAGDPNYNGPTTTQYMSVTPSTTDGSWSVTVETPEVGDVDVDWEVEPNVYFDRYDSLGTPATYSSERIMYSVAGASSGTVTVNSGETKVMDDIIYED